MANIKFILIVIIVSSAFLGCVQPSPSPGTPTPIPTASPTATAVPTVTQVIPTPTPVPTPVRTPRTPAAYRTEVDDDYGFYKVIAINSTQPSPYKNNTLTIYAGDNVIWASDSDYIITIVSEQGLWNNTSAILRWRYKEFNYTFTQPGTYGVYIKEYPRAPHQRIVVNP